MAAATAPLVDALRQYRLLEPPHLEEVTRALQACFPDPKALAEQLVGRGWLTPFQADLLLQGRGQELLLGSYVLLEKLGEGGMGAVFKARNWKLGRVVAVKVIRPEHLANPPTVRRFEREVRAAAHLDHPNIVHAYDADQVGGAHLLVMEYVEGTDLARLVKERGPLPADRACDFIRQAALGLQHAFERGLVHRDIKPHNLLLSRDGVVKVLDLGIARLNPEATGQEASSTMTQENVVLGTADYMAPEQASDSHAADIRSDLYSLGCTLYYLLTGRVPFPVEGAVAKLVHHQLHPPTPVEQLRPDVPAPMAEVVRKLMAKKPDDRYQTPAEAAEALAGTCDRLSAGGTGALLAGGQSETLDSAAEDLAHRGDTLEGTAPPPRRRREAGGPWLLLAGMAGGALALVVVVGLLVVLGHLPASDSPREARDTEPAEGNPAPQEAANGPAEVFQDFESGTYGDWTRTGTAFGDKPARGTLPGQHAVTGFGGKYLVNTFLGGDKPTGTLTSPSFTVQRPYINFRIGGGSHAGKTCMNLLVGGKEVRTATGKSREALEWASWDVREFHGQRAAIEIIDRDTGPWGHINIDDIQFADEPAGGTGVSPPKATGR
jgi:tRNA A-37 threonylcarbamoyl transferase component Bud32